MAYITVQNIRDEGVSDSQYTDGHIKDRIALAQETIELLTGRFFEPRSDQTFKFDGTGHDLLWLTIPPITVDAISSVTIDDIEVDSDDYEFFIRLGSDWRFNPKLRMFYGTWPKGNSNIEISGDFGFVESDGENTPPLIKDLCKRIAIWGIGLRGDADTGRSQQIIEESLGDYRYRLSEAAKTGLFGDPTIDNLIDTYKIKHMGTL